MLEKLDHALPGGAYTLSLSGDAGFRVWTTTPAIGEPLLVGGQTVTNGVGVTFLSGDDTDLFVEAVSNGTATLTYAFAGSNISCAASLKMTAWDIEFVHAEGDDEGKPMEELPIFTPCSGTGKGVPIYDSPDSDLVVSFSPGTNTNGTRNAVLTYLGTQYGVTETASNSLIFANQDITALFSDTLLSDTNVAETVTATVTQSALGIADAVYACTETNALNNVFANDPYGVVATLDGLSDSETNLIHIRITGMSCDKSFDLVENAPDSKCFSSTGLVVRIVGSPELTPAADTLLLSLSDGAGLSNTVFAVHETGGETLTFRNYAPPVSTDTADVPMPDFAPWRVKILGIANPALISAVALTTAVDRVEQITFSASGNDLISDQIFVLAPNKTFEAEIPAVYKPLRIDTSASKWWDANQKGISAEVRLYAMMSGCSKQKNMKEKLGALVIESLEWLSKVGREINTKGRFTEPLDGMGYAVYHDYSASATNLLANGIKGKQIWYSLSHGGLEYGTADSEFMGLLFLNGESIMASDLEPLNLDYRLVMVDGCCSAKTTSDNLAGAYNNNSLAATVEDFANSFGDKSAYVGWAWKMDAGNAQQLMAEFLQNLKYDKKEKKSRTVEEAHDVLLEKNPDPSPEVKSEAKLMKIYGKIDNVVDLTGGGK